MSNSILLVEDDATIASGLMYALEKEEYLPFHCKNIEAALSAIQSKQFDLAILDMQLPDGSGTEVSDRLKKYGTPVIFLTIVDDENEIVRSFEDGAVDYITKPFRLRELLARIKRTLNVNEEKDSSQTVTLGKTVIDTAAGKVYVDGKLIELTALEYRLLLIFAANKSILLTREQILEKIWDSSGNFVEDNTLTVYIKRLREKLGDGVNIQTVRGIGYRVD
ncbi:MAG: response regulator transcription factor [Clostridiales bacterium]|nr:response regulator transcription factor [Clostridiales bacterium]